MRLNRKNEQGVIITLVAVFMLFIVGAMAALSIDVVTLYTAQSEAKLAADGAALAGARVLANSGATSDMTGALLLDAEASGGLAQTVAIQVAKQNQVGGAPLTSPNVTVTFGGNPPTNPTVNVTVQVNLPTFFARIWGTTQVTVAASATAEAYNPSPAPGSAGEGTPVAPICVKPWLLPNIDPILPPTSPPTKIFDTFTGEIKNPNLLGSNTNQYQPASNKLELACGDLTTANPVSCAPPMFAPVAWQYYPGNDDPTSFPHPTFSLPECSAIPTPKFYQNSIMGCIQVPIACNSQVNIDQPAYPGRRSETAEAVNCLTHNTTAVNTGDKVTTTAPPIAPIQFVAGADNPVVAAGSDIMVSDSLVTVPVFDDTLGLNNPVQIVGFVQLFLNPGGARTPSTGPNTGHMNTKIINLAGCGTGAMGTPILGNGASPVAVRLISP